MTSATESLKDLHQIHLDIEQAKGELKRGPMQLKAREQIANKKDLGLKDFLGNLKKLKMTSDSKSLDLKTLEQKLESLAAKLNTASSNREFDAIKGQIAADTVAISVLEDELIELMDRVEEMSEQQKSVEQELTDAKTESSRFTEQFSNRSVELKKQLADLNQKLQSAEKILPPEPLSFYRRLVIQKGAKALAKLQGSACSNCFVSITAQQKILINTGAYEFCTNCGSLLYKDEQEETES